MQIIILQADDSLENKLTTKSFKSFERLKKHKKPGYHGSRVFFVLNGFKKLFKNNNKWSA